MVSGLSVAFSDYSQESAYGPSHQKPYTLHQMYSVEYRSTEHGDPSPPGSYMDFSATPVIHEGTNGRSLAR